MPIVTLVRATGYADSLRSYHVKVDGKKVAKIRDGERISFAVDPGSHQLTLTVDWLRSNRIALEAADGEALEFECGNTLNESGSYHLSLLYVTVLRHKYLWLRQVAR